MGAKALSKDVDVQTIKQRFLVINRDRLLRVQENLRAKQRDFLELLPLMFHLNHPMLPGYVSKETPSGISDYVPAKRSLEAAKRFTKSFEYKKRALRTHDIHSIFLMGSSGTVAQSDKSDLDIWICHRPGLTKEQLSELAVRGKLIEEWATTLNLEVHFFLMNAETFRQGDHVGMDSESSGTAQHHLLLEEFYRTGLLIAGRYPAWWLVPPDHEHEYDAYLTNLTHRRFIGANEIIDFGGLATIPSEEFFGAALWQVYKGIDSPYKSVLKIMLMETYAQEYPNIDLLCLRFKRAIYDGETHLDRLDPYIMLVTKLDEYLSRRNEKERLDLVRRCFYFKVNMALSEPATSKQSVWQRELMERIAANWDWNEAQLIILDTRHAWKINRVLRERKILVEELTHSYLFLSDFARKNARLTHISQTDLTLLGRKLYAAFERKAGKIEIVNRGIAPDLIESHLLLQETTTQEGQESWTLYHGGDSPLSANASETPLKRGGSPVGLLVWAHYNKLMNPQTVLNLRTQSSELGMKEVRSIIGCLEDFSPAGDLPHSEMSSLSKPPSLVAATTFVNVGQDPMSRRGHGNADVISNKSDVLNYSGFSMNLVLSVDYIAITTWQEVMHNSFHGIEGLLECLCQHLQWNVAQTTAENLPSVNAHSFSSNHGFSIAKRLEQLFTDVVAAYYRNGRFVNVRYILQCEQSYYIIYKDQDTLIHTHKENYAELMRYLAEPRPQFSATVVDRHALADTVLPLIYSANKPRAVQLFYQINGKVVDIYVIDENGSLFSQRLPYYDENTLINQYDQFFESTINRLQFINQRPRAEPHPLRVEFYQIGRSKTNKLELSPRQSTRGLVPRRFFNVQVINTAPENTNHFSIFCDEKEFTTYEFGNDLFKEVAKFVLSQRRSGLRYPIHITDIDLPPTVMGDKSASALQTASFLNYKKRIEDRLNQELEKL